MNEQQYIRSERIASRIMRSLAVIGLVSLLALAAWLIVQGVRIFPESGNGLRAAVTSVTSFFRDSEKESLSFSFASNTYASGDTATIRWTYTGNDESAEFMFAYNCVEGVSFSMFGNSGWNDLACNTPISINDTTVTLIPTAKKTRFSDVTLSVAHGDSVDTRMITIINSDLETALPSIATSTATENNVEPEAIKPDQEKPVDSSAVKPALPVTPPTKTPVVVRPVIRTSADLAVAIQETGVLADVAGRSTFFALDPIPNNKTAAVKFTVTNQGGTRSGSYTFVANLPTEGDADYRYVSKVQASLEAGAQMEFTLGFDELLEEKTGTIRVTIVPTDTIDNKVNNTDSVTIGIDRK